MCVSPIPVFSPHTDGTHPCGLQDPPSSSVSHLISKGFRPAAGASKDIKGGWGVCGAAGGRDDGGGSGGGGGGTLLLVLVVAGWKEEGVKEKKVFPHSLNGASWKEGESSRRRRICTHDAKGGSFAKRMCTTVCVGRCRNEMCVCVCEDERKGKREGGRDSTCPDDERAKSSSQTISIPSS